MDSPEHSIKGLSYQTIHKAVIESSKDAILICDNEGSILDYNQGFLQLWNLIPDELDANQPYHWYDKVVAQIASPDPGEQIPHNKVSQNLPGIHELLNGKFIEITSRPLILAEVPNGEIWYFNDITDRETAKKELERKSEVMRAVFEQSMDGMLVVDEDQKVLDFNQVYLEMFKLDPEFLVNEDPARVIDYSVRQLRQTERYRKEIYDLIRHPNLKQSSIIEFLDGRIVERFTEILKIRQEAAGRILFYRDISEATEQLNKLMERTYELDSFIYSASHDLKAPLNTIMGLLDIVKGEELGENVRRFVELMEIPIEKLNFYILNLARFAQNEKYEIQNQIIDLEELIRETLADSRSIQGMEKIEIFREISEHGAFYSDPVRLKAILQNIFSNAVKFRDETKDQCWIRIHVEPVDQGIEIKIKDNGIGIAQDHLSKIYNLFYRASAHAPGSGLGLYVVQQTLNKIGGNVECASRLQSWTEFRVQIPNMVSG